MCDCQTLKKRSPSVLGDMYNQEGDATEPEWVKTEREQFTEFRDKNKDGKMDKDETRDWILPNDYDHAEAEAKHLVYESDTDKVRSRASTINRRLLTVACVLYEVCVCFTVLTCSVR